MGIFNFLFKRKSQNKEEPKNVSIPLELTMRYEIKKEEGINRNEKDDSSSYSYVEPFEKYREVIFSHLYNYMNFDDSKYQHNYSAYANHHCQYCGFVFDKPLTRKRKCPKCSETFIIRTNYITKKKLVLEAEREDELQNDIQTYHTYTSDLRWALNMAANLGAKENDFMEIIKLSPNKRMNDVLWRLCNQKTMEYFSEMKMGLYRNTRFQMAEILEREERLTESLKIYLSVFYLDCNGPKNTTPSIIDKYPPFDKEFVFIAPGLIRKIDNLIKELNIQTKDLKALFENSIETGYTSLLVTTPEESWEMLLDQLKEYKEFQTEHLNKLKNGYDKVITAEIMHENNKDIKEIIQLLNEALADDINDNFKARAHKLQGLIYLDSDKEKALVNFKKALNYNDKIGVKRLVAKLEKDISS